MFVADVWHQALVPHLSNAESLLFDTVSKTTFCIEKIKRKKLPVDKAIKDLNRLTNSSHPRDNKFIPRKPPSTGAIEPEFELLKRLVIACSQPSLRFFLEHMFQGISSSICSYSDRYVRKVLFSFVEWLLERHLSEPDCGLQTSNTHYRSFVYATLSTLIKRFRQEPPPSKDLPKEVSPCQQRLCLDCRALNPWLRDANRTVYVFHAEKTRREHLQYRFDMLQ